MEREKYIPVEEFEEEKKYWLDKLSGKLREVKLPGDFPLGNKDKTAVHKIFFEQSLVTNLMRISKRNDLSLFIILLASFKILLFKYIGRDEIIVASPTYSVSRQDYNRCVLFRDFIHPGMTFKEILGEVRQTTLEGYKNQYYPIERLIDLLDIRENLSLFRLIFLFENIHDKTCVEEIREDFENDITCSVREIDGKLEADIIYNAGRFKEDTIKRLFNSYLHLLGQVVTDTGIMVNDIELMTENEKNEILFGFNHTEITYPSGKTIHRIFEEQAARTPGNIVVSAVVDLDDVYDMLETPGPGMSDSKLFEKFGKCCFKKNSFIVEAGLDNWNETRGYKLLKTHRHNSVVVNDNLVKLLNLFDGKRSVRTIFQGLKDSDLTFIIYSLKPQDVIEVSYEFKDKADIFPVGEIGVFVQLVKSLYNQYLIELENFGSHTREATSEPSPGDYFEENEVDSRKTPLNLNALLNRDRDVSTAQVLFLGDTPGMQTVGLLHMASYLRRNGIKSYCQFYNTNWSYETLKSSIEELLTGIQPEIVAVSMKWFPHIARVLEICKIVKEFAAARDNVNIKVVIGGNTASYYWEEIIRYEWIDYIIRGEGELPLLQLCRKEEFVSNCIYKKDGKVVENSLNYLEDSGNCEDLYLSHLDEIMLSRFAPLPGTFFIYTHKGCGMNCFYCGGCNDANKIVFNRRKLFRRRVEEVRKDILEAKKYASTFLFDFDAPDEELLEYCKMIWGGIDLSSHFCIFTNLIPPSSKLIELVNKTFKYVYWNLDIASLSERHRKELVSLRMVKPQPSDEAILAFFDECEKYDNSEIRFNLIAGLPRFTEEDMRNSDRILSHIFGKYTCCSELHWARLHAQPGAPLTGEAGKYDMYSFASNFEDFLKYSQMNFSTKYNVDYYNYPYIYFNDENFNARISSFYSETNIKVEEYKNKKRRNMIVYEHLSYGDLNERANRLCAILREKGVQPGDIVGLMAQESLDAAAGILGILKVGGAYLPIARDYPKKRKTYIVEDSHVKVVVKGAGIWDEDADVLISLPVVLLTFNHSGLSSYGDTGKETGIESAGSPSDLAYLIYTSGTTGDPKGVTVEHKGVVNYTHWRIKSYQLTEKDVTLQLLSYYFDGYNSNFFSSMLSGGMLVMVPDSRRLDYYYIKEILEAKGVTNLSLVPGMYESLLGIAGEDDLKTTRFVVLAGESTGENLLNKSLRKNPGIIHINEYGPTEATVTAAANLRMTRENIHIIGKPIANTHIYILDPSLNITPVGVPGELCIQGVGVSRGYLNNPELTAAKFVLFCPTGGTVPFRIYRSGDWARWLPGGSIEFLGRLDHQVKIRGYRIETGEIEVQLMRHEKVKEVVVIARETRIPAEQQAGDRDKYLCAYIVSQDLIDESVLREFLADKLPYYMIPSYFVQIESMPLTPGGKTDRMALAAVEVEYEFVAPRDEAEQKMAEIWRDVLEIEIDKIGVDSNFFELGGHSLKATILASRIHNVFNVKIQLENIFKLPTVRELSQFIKGAAKEKFLSIRAAEKKEYYPLSSAQRRLYILQQLDVESTQYNTPIFWQMEGEPEKDKVDETFRKIIERHANFRMSFLMVNEIPVQKLVDSADIDFSIDYGEIRSEREVKTKCEDFVRPFNFTKSPLMRAGFIKYREDKYWFMVDMHHIITDGVSMNILLKEFIALFGGKGLPPLRLQYQDYVEWEKRQLQSGILKKQEEYWLNIFQAKKNNEKIPQLNLPTDYPRPPFLDFSGGSFDFGIDGPLTGKLKTLTSKTGTTLYILLLAVYTLLLSKYTGQEDVIVGAPVSGRTHHDLNNVIGMFVNMLAIRNFPGCTKTFNEFLREVKEKCLAAYENQDYPFDMLVEKLNSETVPGRHQLVEVVFVLDNIAPSHGNPRSHVQSNLQEAKSVSPGNSRQFGMEKDAAKFDLKLSARETPPGITFSFEYRKQLFREKTIQRMSRHFRNLLEAVIQIPDAEISEIDMLEQKEVGDLMERVKSKKDTFETPPPESDKIQSENEKIEGDFRF